MYVFGQPYNLTFSKRLFLSFPRLLSIFVYINSWMPLLWRFLFWKIFKKLSYSLQCEFQSNSKQLDVVCSNTFLILSNVKLRDKMFSNIGHRNVLSSFMFTTWKITGVCFMGQNC